METETVVQQLLLQQQRLSSPSKGYYYKQLGARHYGRASLLFFVLVLNITANKLLLYTVVVCQVTGADMATRLTEHAAAASPL